jgi:hypothetical protein
MAGHVVRKPRRGHHCDPPEQDTSKTLTGTFMGHPIDVHPWVADGTVWQCECGRRWVATYPYVNLFAPTWRQTWLSSLGFRRRPKTCDCFIADVDLPNPSWEPCPVHGHDRLETREQYDDLQRDGRPVQPG